MELISRQDATAKLLQSINIISGEFGNELTPEQKAYNEGLRKAIEIVRSLPEASKDLLN